DKHYTQFETCVSKSLKPPAAIEQVHFFPHFFGQSKKWARGYNNLIIKSKAIKGASSPLYTNLQKSKTQSEGQMGRVPPL
ncbi:MAG: hypothetical protein ACI4J1_02065, partial [Ruminiclostridium sp.]